MLIYTYHLAHIMKMINAHVHAKHMVTPPQPIVVHP